MCEINLEDLEKAKTLFQYYRYKYEEIAIAFSKLNYTDTKYSNIYIDFFPYQSTAFAFKVLKVFLYTLVHRGLQHVSLFWNLCMFAHHLVGTLQICK